jgi:predicted TIM-barrel fold metal-dependent hydrolase
MSVTELLREMDRLEVEKAVLCPNKPFGYALGPANQMVAKAVRQHPDRFLGWARVDPWQGQQALVDIKFAIEVLGLNGVLLHPYEELFQISEHLVDPLMEYAKVRGLPVMIEGGYALLSHPLDIAELAQRYPEVCLIGTHGLQMDDAGFALTDADVAMRECPNIVMESSGMYAPDSMLTAVNQARLVFGSHSPWMNMEFEIDRIQQLAITEEQRADVFGRKILEIFEQKAV